MNSTESLIKFFKLIETLPIKDQIRHIDKNYYIREYGKNNEDDKS